MSQSAPLIRRTGIRGRRGSVIWDAPCAQLAQPGAEEFDFIALSTNLDLFSASKCQGDQQQWKKALPGHAVALRFVDVKWLPSITNRPLHHSNFD